MSASSNPLSADLDHILDHTRKLWDELRGQRIFVTGGTGFIGCWLLESFAWANERLALGAEMLVLTRDFEAFKRKAPQLADCKDIRFQVGDVRDFEFSPEQFSHVVYAAGMTNLQWNQEHPELMIEAMMTGTRRALDFSEQCGARKLLLTTSGAVNGRQPPEMSRLSEEYMGPPRELSLHFSAHWLGYRLNEYVAASFCKNKGIELKIARCFAFVGAYQPLDGHFAIANFIRDGLAGGPIVVQGDGTPYRSYLYAADLAIWLWTILFRGTSNRPYNVGSSEAITIAETAGAVSGALGGNIPVNVLQEAKPGQPAQRYVPDTTRAHTELGLRQWVPLDESIRRTATWHRRE